MTDAGAGVVITLYVQPLPQAVPVAEKAAAEPAAPPSNTMPEDAVRTPEGLIVMVQLEHEFKTAKLPKFKLGLAAEKETLLAALALPLNAKKPITERTATATRMIRNGSK